MVGKLGFVWQAFLQDFVQGGLEVAAVAGAAWGATKKVLLGEVHLV